MKLLLHKNLFTGGKKMEGGGEEGEHKNLLEQLGNQHFKTTVIKGEENVLHKL